jgi:hypothetical protein
MIKKVFNVLIYVIVQVLIIFILVDIVKNGIGF